MFSICLQAGVYIYYLVLPAYDECKLTDISGNTASTDMVILVYILLMTSANWPIFQVKRLVRGDTEVIDF